MPLQANNSPQAPDELQQRLAQVARGLDAGQLQWASGYLAGLAAAADPAGAMEPAAQPQSTVSIWYGSETGNGRGVAERLAGAAREHGHDVDLASLANVPPRRIGRTEHLLLVMSTHGEGDPPADAAALYKLLHSERAPRLDKLSYAVFALGDSSYPDFCQTGRDFDEVLAARGGQRLLDRVEVDVDFEPDEDSWREQALAVIEPLLPSAGRTPGGHLQVVRDVAAPAHDRRNPFAAEVLEIAPLTVAPSRKTVCHLALGLDGSGLEYQPGDALGLWPTNPPELVAELIERLGLDATEVVDHRGRSAGLHEWLSRHLELTQVTRSFVSQYAEAGEVTELRRRLDQRDAYQDWARQRQVVDVVREYPFTIDAATLVGVMRGIAPRLYSIASSPLSADDEVHLTVKLEGGSRNGRLRAGAASWQLARASRPGDRVPVYVEANPRFRLPADGDRPIIMIGPGTGIAPFRAFVEHRQALGHAGRNWLFFGEQHRRTDFLYQLEWQRHLKSGALDRLSVAFSRDQAEKVYVQQRLLEAAPDVYDWLENGASIYVCGSGQGMAGAVHQALLDVVGRVGARGAEQAAEYLERLVTEGRYLKDVY